MSMSRGGSYGGGQSSLGYLFGSDDKPTSPPVTFTFNPPPYGTDADITTTTTTTPVAAAAATTTTTTSEKPPTSPDQKLAQNVSNNYQRALGQNSGNFITDRPSTKVKSVPGGDSSLGYLFGDK